MSIIAAILAAAASLILAPAGPAHAVTPSTTLNFTGDKSLQARSFNAGCDDCIPGDSGAGVRLTAAVSAHWTPSATVTYQYSSSLLRQGQTLDLSDKLTPGSGPLALTWSLTGDVGQYNFTDSTQAAFPDPGSEINTVPINLSVSDTSTCPLKLDGDGSYACQATHTFDVFDASILGQGVKISVPLTTSLQITPDGVVTVRSISIAGAPTTTSTLTWHGPSPSTIADPIAIPCSAVPGNSLVYDLTSSSTTPSYSSTTTVNLKVDITVIFTINVLDQTIVTVGPDTGTMTLTAPSSPLDLGPVLANNIPPTIGLSTSTYTGNEGAPVQFDASGTTSVCPGTLTYVWDFSDGGRAYGAMPQHTFTDNGLYSGLLTVSDPQGNTAKESFSADIANVKPVADAGPDTSGAWGRSLAFNGNAVDPSSVDQNTLAYTWDFGDGTPPLTIADGGSSTSHAYRTPGTYTATLTVRDKDGATSDPSTRTITVIKRDVTLSYLGTTSGTFDTPASFSASLVDEFGSPVNAGPVTFAVGPENEGTVGTNSAGIAAQTRTIGLTANGYTLTAAYPGNGLYNTDSATAPFTVGLKSSTVTYTGATTGGPNKTITLSAVVKDSSGTALSGVTVDFALGTQSASAVTDANGIAATSLKLVQKNGTYTLTASFAGTAGKYAGSAASATFKLQAK